MTTSPTATHQTKQGFTLVELSIVLVIIGLILGGVMVGRSMIRSSQVNRVASDLQSYEAAMNMFVDKYQGLPGDITNATTFWSSTIVANGNGNGQMDVASAASTAGEIFGAWEQMALANLIKGSFSGLAGTGGTVHALIGINVPKIALSGSGCSFSYYGNQSSSVTYYDGFYGNILQCGMATTNTTPGRDAFSPQEAMAIDTKIDDGVPGTGILRVSHHDTACNTGTATTGSTSTYLATSNAIACPLIFITGL
jgi:prepilin-type N-terminal cleavage/methylation domain-containing protein